MQDYNYALNIMKEEVKNKHISPDVKCAFQSSIEALEKQIAVSSLEFNKVNIGRDLFRGFSPTNGNWIIGDGIHYPKSNDKKGRVFIDGINGNTSEWVEVKPETIGKFTGRVENFDDSVSSKMIFTGDIVEFYYGIYTYLNVVFFDEKDLSFSVIEDNGAICPLSNYDKYYGREIIGDTFHNLDLLTETQKMVLSELKLV